MMKKVKKWICFMLGTIFLLQIHIVPVQAETSWPEGTGIIGETAIVMEASTGTVLYEKNAYTQYYPASITKIMTALLAIENSGLDEKVVFSQDAVYKTEGSGIARDVDEVMTMEQCLYGLMLESANECAYAIAEHVGGDYGTFIRMMNEKADSLGCENTHFNNPHGLPDEGHYTCAYDMALISKEALKNETFCQIAGTKSYTIPPTNKHEEETYLRNSHQMLNAYRGAEYLYDGCIGGKTGYTSAAKNTLVTFVKRDGMTLICVVLYEEATKQYIDTITLLDYCFEHFQVWNVAENEKYFTLNYIQNEYYANEEIILSLDKNGYIVLPKTAAFTDADANVEKDFESDDKAGSIAYTFGGRQVGGTDLIITEVKATAVSETEVTESPLEDLQPQERQNAPGKKIKYILFGILVVILLFLWIKSRGYQFIDRLKYYLHFEKED